MTVKNQKEIDILEAAVKVFSRNGFHRSKMQDIANEASVGKGTLYEYFKSKADLFEKMMGYGIDKYIDELEIGISKSKDIEEVLLNISKFHGRFLNEHIDMVQTFMNNTANITEDLRCKIFSKKARLLNTIVNYIKVAKKDGLIRADIDEKVCAMSIFGTLNQFYTSKIFIEQKKIDDIDPHPVVNILLNGIR